MVKRNKIKLSVSILVLLFLVIGVYAYSRTRDIVNGVALIVSGIENGERFDSSLIHIEGNVKNATKLSVNDRELFVDEDGTWKDDLLLQPGYTIVSIKAEDRFGKKTEKEYHVLYKESGYDFTVKPKELPPPAPPETLSLQETITNTNNIHNG